MTEIGIIPENRLRHIPKRHRAAHEFCFHLHDLMGRLLVDTEAKQAHHVRFEFDNDEEAARLTKDTHILDFLAQTGGARSTNAEV